MLPQCRGAAAIPPSGAAAQLGIWSTKLWIAAGLAIVLVGASQTVHANQVAPLVPVCKPPKAPELAFRFQEALATGATAGGARTVDPATVQARVQDASTGAGCAAARCAASAQTATGTTRAITATISAVGKNYGIQVLLYDGRRVVSQAAGRCDICTLREAIATTHRLAAQAVERAPKPSAAAAPQPNKPGPDNSPSGRPASAANRAAAQTAPGQDRQRTPGSTNVEAGAEVGKQWPLWPVLASAGAALVGLGVGIPLIAIDGQGTSCRGEPRPDYRNCERLYSTSGAGWALTSLGLAAMAASGVLLYLHLTTKPSERREASLAVSQVAIAPLKDGFVLGTSGAF